MSKIIIDANEMKSKDFNGASIYLDACFIITFLDKDDDRQADVIEAITTWAECSDTRLAISNHTVIEVVNRFFHSLILTSIETYHKNNYIINQTPKGYDRLSDIEKAKLGNLETARFIYKVAKETGILQVYRNSKASANVTELIKVAKKDYPNKRYLLDVFYNKAVEMFEVFYANITERLGLFIDILGSTSNEYYLYDEHMRKYQLEPTDSFHLAVARVNSCDYFATLDNDFISDLYDEKFGISILKVA